MASSGALRQAVPLVASGALCIGGGSLLVGEFQRELPEPCQVVAAHLEHPDVSRQLGFVAAPWSIRLWHGHVGDHFARVSFPLFAPRVPFPDSLPWLRIIWRRSTVHAALSRGLTGEWEIVSLLEDDGVARDGAAGAPTPRRTDDIIAAETGRSVRTSD
mmetsp:Transcript_63095/g.137109  ORF Transcript_63095/g.137109 Transcript_63095/m.137109 type:complete len:159 (+) Transcript_63095:41-517(+)